ncbi:MULTISPECIES: ATP-binding cassette domain-containing protein [unclassified Microbacterium]|uniref:branched-chain amino acid ABC transporter ATP-binding protein/permease n=1 Tax=unclassified Microbacterium TaxID=2609290 RepID=UPI000C2C252F|nr:MULTISPECIES: ATP-binding cassette domain-containing protein [unclassified Microbacterium]
MSLASTAIARRQRTRFWIMVAAAVVVAVAVTFGLPSYFVFISTTVLVTMVSLMGLGIVTGSAGMIALSQLTFAAIGAWVMELLIFRTPLGTIFGGVSFIVCMLIGAVAAAIVGLIVGLPALRLRGVNLAVITLGVAAAADMTLQKVFFPDAWVNQRVPRPFGISNTVEGDRIYFLFTAIVVIVIAAVVFQVGKGRFGAMWRFVAFSERGTAAAGTKVRNAKLSAFAASAFIGGLAGGLTVGQIGQVNYISFATAGSLGLYVLCIVVGAHYIDMAFVGACLFVFIPEILKQFGLPLEWANIIFGILGVQALTTNTTMGDQIRSGLRKLRRRGEKVEPVSAHLEEVDLEQTSAVFTTTGKPLLEVKDVSVVFGELRALDHVSLTVFDREVVGLIGPNGAGKSTMIDTITGFISGYEGSIVLDGQPVDGLAPDRRAHAGIRRTFQQDRVPTSMTVGQYLRLMSQGKSTNAEIDEILEYFGCPPAHTPLRVVDVGSRRIVEVAANVASKPLVLLLDEPAAGLSHEEHIVFGNQLRKIPQKYGISVLLIEHDLDLVRSVCSKLVVLNFGGVLASGDQEEVLRNPEVLKAYMGERVE